MLIFFIAISLHALFGQVQAQGPVQQSEKSFVEELRPTLMELFGERWTIKLIGALSPSENKITNSVILPPLPKVLTDARSVAVYSKKKDSVKLKPELEQKFYYTFIKEIYEATRQLKPNDDEVAKKMNVLSQGGTREGIYHSLVLDSTYAGMENYDKPVKANAADFAVYFYERYVGKKVDKEKLKVMNIYTLKRLMGDQTLDIIDAYGENRKDIESWYAVMSSDLAVKFPMAWTSQLRKNTSSVAHKSWASRVPVEHIKSESLIKIHSVMNTMM